MVAGAASAHPRTAVVIGAGIVGLSTAWFLQERGVDVTVVDRAEVASGASWGNAGWLSPGLTVPLPEPSVLRYGIQSLLDRRAPLYIPVKPDPRLWSFLARFARHCTLAKWRTGMQAYLPMNAECLEAFDVLVHNGVRAQVQEAPITAVVERREQIQDLFREFQMIRRAGQRIDFTVLDGTELRSALPQVSERAEVGIRLDGQRYIDPGAFVHALADSVVARGGTIHRNFTVRRFFREWRGVTVQADAGRTVGADVAVLATGSWVSQFAKPRGVRVPVHAGRGYSFTVPTAEPVPGPIYLPAVRVACTPYQGALRVAGTMEFRAPDAGLDRKRIEAIIESARPLLDGVSWADRTDEWVGPRPVTPDGLPLIGETSTSGVFLAGGHGMWGLTLGPSTGRLLAEQITTGKQPEALRPFDPLR
ncbi:D-amino-acid dehydrogenase [Tamaricihabitans halophyticus]|uniref:D-amino-acid dehydrogenase n=1 Tax=Tamaricihabitans halophyticus TaxID=1262583 RepID=A0A4R2QFI2_9PSEU|nr:FAD-dependent oxidoreductase [Tamaricihabitans halophyticus]TCP47817.1 D-amino-acid dehydrogenase [Tamaricihabitans halophyticus]